MAQNKFLIPSFVQEQSTTTGIGTYTVSGAISGFRTFASSMDVGDTFPYVAHDSDTGYFEAGIGKLATSTTIERVAILERFDGSYMSVAHNGTPGALNWAAGTRKIYVSLNNALLRVGNMFSSTALSSSNAGPPDGLNYGSFVDSGNWENVTPPDTGQPEFQVYRYVSKGPTFNVDTLGNPVFGFSQGAYGHMPVWLSDSSAFSANAFGALSKPVVTGAIAGDYFALFDAFGASVNSLAYGLYSARGMGDNPLITHNMSRVDGYGNTQGVFSGEAQNEKIGAVVKTINATPKAMYPWDDSGLKLHMTQNTTWLVRGRVVCREHATGDSKAWNVEFVIARTTGNPALIGTVTKTVVQASGGAASWDVTITADATDVGPKVEVTGEAAHTITWVYELDIVQVKTGA